MPSSRQPNEPARSEEDLDDPVSVASLRWEEAWLAAGRLRSEGIPARVFPDSQAATITLAQAAIGGLRDSLMDKIGLGRGSFDVLVSRDRAKEAQSILDAIDKGAG